MVPALVHPYPVHPRVASGQISLGASQIVKLLLAAASISYDVNILHVAVDEQDAGAEVTTRARTGPFSPGVTCKARAGPRSSRGCNLGGVTWARDGFFPSPG